MDLTFFISLVMAFGYAGVFIGSLIGSASIFLPVPSFLFVLTAGVLLNPLLVGIAAGAGSAVGEMTGYAVGYGIMKGTKKYGKKKKKRSFVRLKKWFDRGYGFFAVMLFAATPLPDDVIGIFCGYVRYDAKKFFMASLIGKIALSTFLAYAGHYGLNIADYFFS